MSALSPKAGKRRWIGPVALLGAVGVGAFVVGALAFQRPKPEGSTPVTASASAQASEPTFAEQLDAAADVSVALFLVRGSMQSTAGPGPSLGAELLARWASHRLRLPQLTALKGTSYAKAMKDPDLETGNYVCVTDLRVLQIAADRRWGHVVYRGLLVYESGAVLSFVAAGSSGDIVAGSRASYCGVVTGTWEFPNTGGGFTQSVHTVGMFELPENR